MANRDCYQKVGKNINTKQNTDTNRGRGYIGDKSTKLIDLIGLERITWRHFQFEGTFYVTEDGETYDKEYVDTHKPPRTGVNFYEVSNWTYNEKKRNVRTYHQKNCNDQNQRNSIITRPMNEKVKKIVKWIAVIAAAIGAAAA